LIFADFIGETKLLPVTVEAVSGRVARVILPCGHRITCPLADDAKGPHHHSLLGEPARKIQPCGATAKIILVQSVYMRPFTHHMRRATLHTS